MRTNRARIFLVGIAALMLTVILIGGVLVFGSGSSATKVAPQAQTVAKSALAPTATPSCVPPGSKRCQQEAAKPGQTFDWGEAPKIDIGIGGTLQKPTPIPTLEQPLLDRAKDIPLIGAPVALATGIIGAIDWTIRNLWLAIILAAILATLFRIPIWAPFFVIWEVAQTLWHSEMTLKNVGEEMAKKKWKFQRPEKKQGDGQGNGQQSQSQGDRQDQQGQQRHNRRSQP